MSEHIKILILFLLFLVAFWSVLYTLSAYRRYNYKVLYYCFLHTFAVSILLLYVYVQKYLTINLQITEFNTLVPTICIVSKTLFVLLLTLTVWALYRIWIFFLAYKKTPAYNFAVSLAAIGIPVFYALTATSPRLIHVIDTYIIDNFVIIEIIMLLWIIFNAAKKKNFKEKRMETAFALLFIGRYIYIAVVALSKTVIDDFLSRMTQQPLWVLIIELLFYSGFFFMFAIPVIWIHVYVRPFLSDNLTHNDAQETLFIELMKQYSISTRESEVIRLIMCGKSNKEIQHSLSISYHTVKNHVSTIFQKTHVTTRNELLHLIHSKVEELKQQRMS